MSVFSQGSGGLGGAGSGTEIQRIHPTAADAGLPGQSTDPRSALVRDLASPEDDTCLSGLMCLLRAQIEVFAATSGDVSDRTSKKTRTGGGGPRGAAPPKEPVNSPVPITPGRVGIRCKHCVHLPRGAKAKGAVSYPNSIRIMNQAVRNWQRYHFTVCKQIPMAIKERYDELKAGKRMHSSKASQEYWPQSCHQLGLVDGPDGGIFFDGDAEALRLFEEAAAAQKKAAAEAAAAAAGAEGGDGDGSGSKPRPKPKRAPKKKPTKKNKRDGGGQMPDASQSQPQHFGAMMGSYPMPPHGQMPGQGQQQHLLPMNVLMNANGSGNNGIGGMNVNMPRTANGAHADSPFDDTDLNFVDDVNVNDLDLDLDAWLQDDGNTSSQALVVPASTMPQQQLGQLDGSHNNSGNISRLPQQQQQQQMALPIEPHGGSHMLPSVSKERLLQLVGMASDAIRATLEITQPDQIAAGTFGENNGNSADESGDLLGLGKELYALFADRPTFGDEGNDHANANINVNYNGGTTATLATMGNRPTKRRVEQQSLSLSIGGASSQYVPLVDLGFPVSISNMISSLLGVTAQNYSTTRQVQEDLHTMLTNPERYLYDPNVANVSGQLDIGSGIKLYGQDANIEKLRECFDRVLQNSAAAAIGTSDYAAAEAAADAHAAAADGGFGSFPATTAMSLARCEVALVAGLSGTGKSSLIYHVRDPMIQKGGCFIAGKFDETRKTQPLSAVVDALEHYCDLLAMESPDTIGEVRQAIKDSVGDDASILTGLVPGLLKIIGQPEGKTSFTLGSMEAHKRLVYLFGRLMGAIARPSRPLIFFLDDLQWADEFSIELLRSFVCDTFLPSLLILGCYRENEVGDGHPLQVMLGKVTEAVGSAVETIRIGNMDQDTVNVLLSDALHMLPRLTEPLTRIVYYKTDGNGMFVVQFFQSLCDEGLLTFSLMSRRWEWDIEGINSRNIADDVVGLLTTKMLKLDTATLWGLKIASCLGSQCDDSTIQYLGTDNEGCENGMSPLLDVAVNEGLMFKVDSTYSFAHDEIQNAAYSLIPETERKSVHLQIGKALCSRVPEDQLDSVLFIAVDQLFRGADVISSQDEIIRLAYLALRAGNRAMTNAAYLPASLYLLQAIGLLEESDWTNHYDLTLQLYSAAAETCYVLGNFEILNELAKETLTKAACLQDKIRIYFALSNSLANQGKLLDAIDFGLGVLEQLGEPLPPNLDDDEVIAKYVMETSIMMRDIEVNDIIQKAAMQDEAKQTAMQFLSTMAMHSYLGRPKACPVISARMVQLTLSAGLCKESAFAFSMFGVILSRSPDGVNQGYRISKIALSLMEQMGDNGYIARVYACAYGLINCFVEPLQACVEPLKYAHEAGMANGDMGFAHATGLLAGSIAVQSGSNLESIAYQLSMRASKMTEANDRMMLHSIRVYECFARNLMGETDDPTQINHEGRDLLDDMLETQNKNARNHYYFARMILAYMFGRYELAADMAVGYRNAIVLLRNATLVNSIFYLALIALASADEDNKVDVRRSAGEALSELEGWVGTSEWNYLHKMKFLQAEIALHDGNYEDAAALYDEAIRIASDHRFIHEQALASERCGIFYSLRMSNAQTAAAYFTKAAEMYMKWGAKRKAADLLQMLTNSNSSSGDPFLLG